MLDNTRDMTFNESMEYISSLGKFSKKPGLSRIRELTELLGNPQDNLEFVHVAGTNGKGSVVSFVSSVLTQSGYKVGIFTSPFIQRFNERIKIGTEEIPDEDVAKYTSLIKNKVNLMTEEQPTEFDVLTVMAFLYFSDKHCDIVVLEVGIGGIIDSTNIIKDKKVAVITSISFDHIEFLGNTIEEIAKIKAGIITENTSVVSYPQKKNVSEILKATSKSKHSNLQVVDEKKLSNIEITSESTNFSYKNLNNLTIQLLGDYQVLNACTALETIFVLQEKGYSIKEEHIREGFKKTRWAGRLEKVSENPIVLIDGAHNVQGAKSLAYNLKKIYNNKKFIFITGVMSDKDYENMYEDFLPLANMFITIKLNTVRALDSEVLAEYFIKNNAKACAKDTIEEAINFAMEKTKDEVICAFGSLYFIGEVRTFFSL